MDPSRTLPLVALVALLAALLGGCQAPGAETATSASTGQPSTDQPSTDQPSAGQQPSADSGRSAPSDQPPSVPSLHPAIDDLDESELVVTTTSGRVGLDVKVAATDAERRRGLMEVEDLPDGAGMLFVFEEDRTGGFWMRNTLIPLDIAYITADGVIATILAMDPCTTEAASDCPVYPPPVPYRTALEVPQGWFGEQGIAEGDRVEWSEPAPPTTTTRG